MSYNKKINQLPELKSPAVNNSKNQGSSTENPNINEIVEQPSNESKEQAEKKSNVPLESETIAPLSLEMNAAADETSSQSNSEAKCSIGSRTKLEQVVDFFNQHKAPELKEISLEHTQRFVEQILEPRLQYNLLTQDVELDGKSLRRHQNETLNVENRILVVCEKEYQVKFQKEKQYKNHLLDALSRRK